MEFTTTYEDISDEIAKLFRATFTDSEGAEEGALVGAFVDRVFATTEAADMRVFSALDSGSVIAAAVFSRMWYPQDKRSVFILSPMAVATSQQGSGIGQKLLSFGLNALRQEQVDIALTYGDINFYSKLGFRQISETMAKAPLPLSYPSGWLGQSLTQASFAPLKGPSKCIDALNDPSLW